MSPLFNLVIACFILLNVLISLCLYLTFRKKPKIATKEVSKLVHQVVQEKLRSGLSRTLKLDEHFSWEPRKGTIRQFLAIYDGYLVLEAFAGMNEGYSNLYKMNREFIEVWHAKHPKGYFFSHMTTKNGGIVVFDNDRKVFSLDTDTGYVTPTEIYV